jgi:hypothetical protein
LTASECGDRIEQSAVMNAQYHSQILEVAYCKSR